jgi:hypothetical protein
MLLQKEHLSPEGLATIRQVQKTINLNNSVNIKTGSSLR